MARRVLESILKGTVRADNEAVMDAGVSDALKALEDELANAESTELTHVDTSANDKEAWGTLMAPFVDRKDTWLSAPWLVAEFYLYRRILDALGYFDPNAKLYLHDPFATQKTKGLAACTSAVSALAPRANVFAHDANLGNATDDQLRLFIMLSLWGNRMDLSIWPSDGDGAESAARAATAVEAALAESASNLLHDDAAAATAAISAALKRETSRVDIVVDNAGFELVTDLALADALACVGGPGGRVVLRVKGHPTFVSDAMVQDVMGTIEALATAEDAGVRAMAGRWLGHLRSGRWRIAPDDYWAQGFPYWTMPAHVVEELTGSDCVVLKGDANYRRLLGDLLWELDTPFGEVAGYMPAPILALRTLKAELGCGMSNESVERARAAAPDDWMVTGRFGVVQYLDAPNAENAAAVRVARTDAYLG